MTKKKVNYNLYLKDTKEYKDNDLRDYMTETDE
jgi:hypothetical protein